MIYPNWTGIVAAVLTAVVFFFARGRMAGVPGPRRSLVTLVLLVFAVPGASFSIYYLHLFPEMEWWYEFRSWRGSEFTMIFVGMAGGAVATFLSRFLWVFPFVLTMGLAMLPLAKPIGAPIPDSAFTEAVENGIWQQSTPSTCGAASVATILGFFEKSMTEREVARAAYTYAGGTEAWYLARVVRRAGLRAEFIFGESLDPSFTFPAMVGVRIGGVGHFIPILSKDGERYRIADPLVGEEFVTEAELLADYVFTGFSMSVSEPE